MKKWESQFQLGDVLTPEQLDFFDQHGVILFRNFLTPDLIQLYISELNRIEQAWLEEKKDKVNGIPLHHSIAMRFIN
jgi:phytanoyl-CoA hydroxylase